MPKEHVHITFLTPWIVFVGILGFQSLSNHYGGPCNMLSQTLLCGAFVIPNGTVLKWFFALMS